ncbi:MAG: metalloregulator ArsR/SmtB family transcription factor [Spirochaetes bacterium]|nr:metalloregulator ArsR/SmtB family transcription factor [Spirochaetota bacterium]
MELLAKVKALSDETRLRIYAMLISHELNVNDIVEILHISQPGASRHLKILAEAGLLSSRRDGLWVFYKATNSAKNAELLKELILSDDEMKLELQRLEERISEKAREKTLFYDALAPRWDKLKRSIVGNIDIAGEIFARIDPCAVAADLGCGTGELLPVLCEKAMRVIGIDKSPKMLELARQRFKRERYGLKIELRIGEIEHLPVRDGEIELAVLNMVLHHLGEPLKGLQEASRALKSGGKCIVVELDQHLQEEFRNSLGHRWLGFSRELMEKWLTSAGLSLKEVSAFETNTGFRILIYVSEKSTLG